MNKNNLYLFSNIAIKNILRSDDRNKQLEENNISMIFISFWK